MQDRNSLKRFRTLGLMSALTIVLSGVTSLAIAVPITYSFTTAAASQSPPSPLSSALTGLNVSGSFTYDADGAFLGSTPLSSGYAGFSSLSGTVGGYSFADGDGIIGVQNDTYSPPFPGAPFDLFVMSAEVTNGGSIYDLSGFDLSGFTLVNVRLFWIESTIGGAPDFLDSSALPPTLPTFTGRLALDFFPAPYTPVDGQPLPGIPDGLTFVFFDGLTATPVSVPEPASLPLLALGLMGAMVARRRARTV